MKVLVTEESNHLKVLEDTYNLLKDRCSVSFYINKSSKLKYGSLFPSLKEANIILNSVHSTTFFAGLLFHARKFDYINISTGSEGSHFNEFLNILYFYLFCIIYRNKSILTIKTTRCYLRSTGGLFSCLRSRSIKKLKRFTFETKTMRDVFKKYADVESSLLGVSYDRYADLLVQECDTGANGRPDDVIRIGLLGEIDSNRKDYEVVAHALKRLSYDKQSKIDPKKEFKEIAAYYNNGEDLLQIFQNIRELSVGETDDNYYDQLSTCRVF